MSLQEPVSGPEELYSLEDRLNLLSECGTPEQTDWDSEGMCKSPQVSPPTGVFRKVFGSSWLSECCTLDPEDYLCVQLLSGDTFQFGRAFHITVAS